MQIVEQENASLSAEVFKIQRINGDVFNAIKNHDTETKGTFLYVSVN